ncbi:MAG TPA: sugar ABC transporter permease [Mesotoga infera]|uniref:Permease component of ABC-type sugar transporter n=2 Tax=Mesotoga infera TaxID=1236046 RepID=A0A7Z7LEU3_9BACT|nr:sugar ABC transporter permease [Mesotoga infera]SSC12756.1 Permease component of ABC-type sugar transporter [Mesotoga infera]HOI64547.1 sugar ABC transporter permease [Mesotoga sp.]HON28591.1 sugar ABC transporter permease [Mesotoga infera]HPD38739.1 sugar ABC transporter permease [Mesotoga infera]
MSELKRADGKWILAFLGPYAVVFTIFIIVPIIMAVLLSFTNFNTIQFPDFVGLKNYISLFTYDDVFMQYVLPNTIKFALIVGPLGYALSFFLAWMLAQIPRAPRTILALIIYSPSMTVGVAMQVIWLTIFSGDKSGYLNSLLMNLGLINQPVQWLQSPQYLMITMIIVTLWSSMGVGFLAMLAGVLNTDPELYEAGYVDGISKRWQEIFYITVPLMKPQMLFGAVMSVVSTFQAGYIGVLLSGSNPTPQYAGQLIVNHIEDYGFLRYEMGYAASISVMLLLMIWISSKFVWSIFGERE